MFWKSATKRSAGESETAVQNTQATALAELVRLLSDDSVDVRIAVAKSLGNVGDRSVVGPLIAAQETENDVVRQAVSSSLLNLGARFDIVPELLERASAPNCYARKAALWVLGELRDPRGLPSVSVALRDKEAVVRLTAAYAVGKFANAIEADQAVAQLIILAALSASGKKESSLKVLATLDWNGDKKSGKSFQQLSGLQLPRPVSKDNGMVT